MYDIVGDNNFLTGGTEYVCFVDYQGGIPCYCYMVDVTLKIFDGCVSFVIALGPLQYLCFDSKWILAL